MSQILLLSFYLLGFLFERGREDVATFYPLCHNVIFSSLKRVTKRKNINVEQNEKEKQKEKWKKEIFIVAEWTVIVCSPNPLLQPCMCTVYCICLSHTKTIYPVNMLTHTHTHTLSHTHTHTFSRTYTHIYTHTHFRQCCQKKVQLKNIKLTPIMLCKKYSWSQCLIQIRNKLKRGSKNSEVSSSFVKYAQTKNIAAIFRLQKINTFCF